MCYLYAHACSLGEQREHGEQYADYSLVVYLLVLYYGSRNTSSPLKVFVPENFFNRLHAFVPYPKQTELLSASPQLASQTRGFITNDASVQEMCRGFQRVSCRV